MRDIPQPAFDAPASDWQVFGDALQDAGDPRGELALDQGRGDASARDAHVREHWGVLVGDVSPDDVELEWRYSVLRGVTLKIRDLVGSE